MIITQNIIAILVLILILIYIFKNINKEHILACSANCGATEIITKDDEDLCLSCKFCGICTTESGDRTCVNGTKDKPLFGADCIDWQYNYSEEKPPINFENKNETDYETILKNLNQMPITKPTKKFNKDIINYQKILQQTDLLSYSDLESQKQLDTYYGKIIKDEGDSKQYKQYYNLLQETCTNFNTLKELSDINQFKLDK